MPPAVPQKAPRRAALHWSVLSFVLALGGTHVILALGFGGASGIMALMQGAGIVAVALGVGYGVGLLAGGGLVAGNAAAAVVALGLSLWASGGVIGNASRPVRLPDGTITRADDPAVAALLLSGQVEELLAPLGSVGAGETATRLRTASELVAGQAAAGPENTRGGLLAAAGVLDDLATQVIAFNETLGELNDAGAFDPASVPNEADLRANIALLESAAADWQRLVETAADPDMPFGARLREANLAIAEEHPALALVRGPIATHVPATPHAFDPVGAALDECAAVTKVLANQWGVWTYNAELGEVVFPDETPDAVLLAYNAARKDFLRAFAGSTESNPESARRQKLAVLLRVLAEEERQREAARNEPGS
ncbi:MAG: hypothetical protein PWP23_2619 [Candidatus Sumerlaeota bacterium]|nr:hypothetical protein [Candidatus Sumerlaeota bacterium]